MLCCHVTLFTVCWQKCHFQKPISLILSEQAGDSPPNLWQQGVHDVFRGLCRKMCEYLFISPVDKPQVLWYRWWHWVSLTFLWHNQVQVCQDGASHQICCQMLTLSSNTWPLQSTCASGHAASLLFKHYKYYYNKKPTIILFCAILLQCHEQKHYFTLSHCPLYFLLGEKE